MATTDKIQIAMAVYDPSGTYSQHAGVVITSIFENTSSPVIINIIHDETLTQENRSKLIRTAEKYSQEINFIDLAEYHDEIYNKFNSLMGSYTIGTLYRELIPDVMPELEKVIYLDCDIIVNLDIKELWDIDIEAENKSFAGVKELNYAPLTPARKKRMQIINCDPEDYINAGILIMNLKKLRTLRNFCDVSLEWLSSHAYLHELPFGLCPDQDAINAIYKGDIKFIDKKFNVFDNLEHDLSNSIPHMCASQKAWEKFGRLPCQKLYWKMYLKSAWGENYTFDDLLDKICSVGFHISRYEYNLYYHERSSQCVKRIFNAILKRIKLAAAHLKYYLFYRNKH